MKLTPANKRLNYIFDRGIEKISSLAASDDPLDFEDWIWKRGKWRHTWKGGKFVRSGGHVIVYAPRHPYAYKNQYFEHRLVMEQHIGRYLDPKEVITHINGILDDNRIENLKLFPNVAAFWKWKTAKRNETRNTGKDAILCPSCGSSYIYKGGTRQTANKRDGTLRHWIQQRYHCVDCGYWFFLGQVKKQRRVNEKSTILCPKCNSPYTSNHSIRNGRRRYSCRECHATFQFDSIMTMIILKAKRERDLFHVHNAIVLTVIKMVRVGILIEISIDVWIVTKLSAILLSQICGLCMV